MTGRWMTGTSDEEQENSPWEDGMERSALFSFSCRQFSCHCSASIFWNLEMTGRWMTGTSDEEQENSPWEDGMERSALFSFSCRQFSCHCSASVLELGNDRKMDDRNMGRRPTVWSIVFEAGIPDFLAPFAD